MQIVPVIDVKAGVVVRAIGGRRDDYRPLDTPLTSETKPLAIARAMTAAVGSNTVYFADIDAITSEQNNLDQLVNLIGAGFEVWADIGIATPEQLCHFEPKSNVVPILGSETLRHLSTLNRAIDQFGPQGVIASVDLRNGELLGRWDELQHNPGPLEFISEAHRRGVRRIIVLDLAAVGEGRGVPTLELCRELKKTYPEIELITGGGIRNREDIENLDRVGVDAVLVSTAIHEGKSLR